ncbi:MAG TPA: hypothetical protein VGH28_13415 [Polyangiaceae bacterium]|jgi:hypothetical protein
MQVDVTRIAKVAGRAERRIRAARALTWASEAACVALVAAVVTLVLRKTNHISERTAWVAFALEAALVIAAGATGWARKLPARAGALALDRHHGLADRLASALSFGELPQAERTPFMDAAIDDALAVVQNVEPKKAVPIPPPYEAPVLALLLLVLGGVSLFEIREHHPAMSQKTIDPVDVTADDLDAFKNFLNNEEQKNQSDEAKDATQEFNKLIEDLANKRLDRTEAFRRMQALEDKLQTGNPADKKAMEDALQKMGEEMKKSDLTKHAGESFENKDLKDAERNFQDLAKQLRQSNGKVDKDQLDKMREALKAAADNAKKNREELEKKRDDLKKEVDLLKKKQQENHPDGGAPDDKEKDLLQKKERELERLDQQAQQAQNTERQLSKLDQDLQQAAEDLMRELGASAQDLDQGAEDIDRMAQQEMTDQEKEELKQKLQELRELLRQQGQGGHQQMVRLQRFQQHARGQGGQGGQGGGQQGQGGDQQSGEGQQGQGQQGQGQQGQGQQGQGQGQQGQGQGQGGQSGQGQGGSEVWVVGPNGEKILMLTRGQGQGGSGQGGQGGQNGQPGHGWGTGHDPHVQGQASNMKTGTQDTQVTGQDTGQGQSRSQVILGAAERGFTNRGYTKVFREYHTVAEEALNKDEIPGGYRFYVRRYFQLIRPRDQQ